MSVRSRGVSTNDVQFSISIINGDSSETDDERYLRHYSTIMNSSSVSRSKQVSNTCDSLICLLLTSPLSYSVFIRCFKVFLVCVELRVLWALLLRFLGFVLFPGRASKSAHAPRCHTRTRTHAHTHAHDKEHMCIRMHKRTSHSCLLSNTLCGLADLERGDVEESWCCYRLQFSLLCCICITTKLEYLWN